MQKNSRGSIGFSVLFAVMCVVVVAQSIMIFVLEEVERIRQETSSEQLRKTAQALMYQAQLNEAEGILENITLDDIVAEPWNRKLTAELEVEVNEEVGVRLFRVHTDDGISSLSIKQLRIYLPDEVAELSKNYVLAAGKEIVTSSDITNVDKLSGIGSVLKSSYSSAFGDYREVNFPATASVLESGLSKSFYYDSSNSSKTISSSKPYYAAKGEGLFIAKQSITVGADLKLPDKCIIVTDGNITVGKGAKLSNILLLSAGTIKIGSDCEISGSLICNGNIEIGENCSFTKSSADFTYFDSAVRVANK